MYWLFATAGFVLAILFWFDVWQWLSRDVEYFGAAICLSVGIVSTARGILMRGREQRALKILKSPDPSDDPVEVAMVTTQIWRSQEWTLLKGWNPTHQRVTEIFTARGWQAPRSIIDQKIADKVHQIPITNELLEPEMIRQHTTPYGYLSGIVWVSLGSWLFLGNWVANGWARIGIGLLACTLLAFASSFINYHFTGRSSENYGTAGLGIIEFGNGKTLRADECITLISKANGLLVRLLAPDGQVIDLTFANPRDPGFITFWQHWNHPNPRPELLNQPTPIINTHDI